MAGQKFLANVSGKIKEIFSVQISAGAGSSGNVVALNSSGQVDITMMPTGIAAETVVVPSSENLSAGAFVNLYNNAGSTNARNADNTTNAKAAHGFVLTAVTSPANATIYILGQVNTGVTGLTPASVYFLGAAGAVTTTPPTTTGNLSQQLGIAKDAATLPTENYNTIEIA